MYVLLKDKVKSDSDIFEERLRSGEKYAVSEPDLYYREESFNSGDTNICFILGHSGSGKSMMAGMLVGEDIDHIIFLMRIRSTFTAAILGTVRIRSSERK